MGTGTWPFDHKPQVWQTWANTRSSPEEVSSEISFFSHKNSLLLSLVLNGYSADSEAFSGDEGLMSGVEVSSGYLSAAGTTSGGDIENNRNKTWPRKQKKLPTVARRTTNSFIWSIRVRPDLRK